MTHVCRDTSFETIVWADRPWVVPSAIMRTFAVVMAALFFLFLEMYLGVAVTLVYVLPIYLWTLFIFIAIWAFSLLDLLLFWVSSSYVLRKDGLEVQRGIIRLDSFVVTPLGFGDLRLYQSVGGRIFDYGDLVINSQGERRVRLALVRSPFRVARLIREVMAKPTVRTQNSA
ncbi:MAG: hypothetical protein NWE93_00845 [Candidatus Bathyarchaeota archaeon]|nr:hypothetical protein [Candidatus Bathyarchaeota archaeon]